MACIRRLGGPTPRWDCIVYLGRDTATGREKRRVKRFYDKKSAELYAARMTVQSKSGGVLPDERVTVHEYLDQWLAAREPAPDHPEVSPVSLTTWTRHQDLCRLHVFPALGHLRLARVTPVVIEMFYKDLQQSKSLSGATLVFIHRMLHKAFRDAVRKGLLMRNPVSSEFIDAPRKGTFTPTIWDAEQVRLFLAAAKRSSPHYALYLLASTSGIREGEALGLPWSDVDLTLGEIHIRRKLYRLKTHDRPTQILVGAPKSKNGIRTVPLFPAVVEELRRLQAAQREHRARLGERYDPLGLDLVFCQPDGCPLHVRNLMVRDFLPLITDAKLPRIRFHDLRHAVASHLIALGVDPHTVARICGHHSATFTLQTYVHDAGRTTADALKRDALARLEARLFPTAPAEVANAPA